MSEKTMKELRSMLDKLTMEELIELAKMTTEKIALCQQKCHPEEWVSEKCGKILQSVGVPGKSKGYQYLLDATVKVFMGRKVMTPREALLDVSRTNFENISNIEFEAFKSITAAQRYMKNTEKGTKAFKHYFNADESKILEPYRFINAIVDAMIAC